MSVDLDGVAGGRRRRRGGRRRSPGRAGGAAERWQQRFELPVVIAALLVIPVIAVEQANPGEPWRTVAVVTNWLIWLVFLAELLVMLAVVPDRWRWLRSHPLEVVIVVLTPPFMPSIPRVIRIRACLSVV